MSMGNDVTKLYKAETGKDAIGSWGNDDTENDMYCYVEGPTMDYVRWLEGRASRTGGSANTPTNTGSPKLPACVECELNCICEPYRVERGDSDCLKARSQLRASA